MSLAAVDFAGGDKKIIDVALKYGYTSPTAFNRAFQAIHGIAPSPGQREGAAVKSFPPLAFSVIVKGAEPLDYRIEKKDAFRIIGISQPLHKEIERNFEIVPNMWQTAVMNGTMQRLAQKITTPGRPAGRSAGRQRVQRSGAVEILHRCCRKCRSDSDGFESCTVPAATWAIFPGSGTNISMRSWNAASLPSGCRHQAMNTPTRQMWKCT